MKDNIIEFFFKQYFSYSSMRYVYADFIPKEMMASGVDEEGWFTWKPIDGVFDVVEYKKIEDTFNISFPKSFIDFHKRYFFLDGDCSLVRLPYSVPSQPLLEIKDLLDNETANELTKINIYPFAMDGGDAGFLVFDGRENKENNEFPVRIFDHIQEELDGLSTIIFSSFSKLLECLTYYMQEVKTRNDFEVIPEFLKIDLDGAGKYGEEYWLGRAAIQKANYEYNKENPSPF